MPENKSGILKFVVSNGVLYGKVFNDAAISLADKYMAETKDDQGTIRMLWAFFLGSMVGKCVECAKEKGLYGRYGIDITADCSEDACEWNRYGPVILKDIQARLESEGR